MGALLVTLLLVPRPALSGPELVTDPSANFRIHYTLSGQDAPVHGAVDSDGNSVPDDVDAVAAGVTAVYDHWVTKAGMRAPLSDGTAGGDGRIDVYLRKLNGPRGNTYVEDVGKAPAASAWIELEPRSALASPARLSAAAGHETHHAIQYAYHTGLARWIYEATATYVENADFTGLQDETDAHYRNILFRPEAPLDTLDGIHEYDEMVFVYWFIKASSGRPLKQLWEALAQEGDALAALSLLYGSEISRVIFDFARWQQAACTGQPRSLSPASCGLALTPKLLVSSGFSSTTTIPLPPLAIAFVALPDVVDGGCGGPDFHASLESGDGVVWGGGDADDAFTSGTMLMPPARPPLKLVFARGTTGGPNATLAMTEQPRTCPIGGRAGDCSVDRRRAPPGAWMGVLAICYVAAITRRRRRAARRGDPAPPSPA